MGIFSKKENNNSVLIAQEQTNIINEKTDFYIHEAYNTLRSNITFSFGGKGCKIVAVTSTNPGEGKSITSLNTAISFAEANKRVLIIDADMRRPKLHRLLDTKAAPGFSNILVNDCDVKDVIRKYGNIDAICAGEIPPNSTTLLESDGVETFFDSIRDEYDYIIIDTPPVNSVVDSCLLAKYTSGIVFVIKQNCAKKEQIVSAVSQLEFAGGKIIGFVLNDIIDKNLISVGKYRKLKYNRYKKYKSYSYTNDEK